MFLFIEGKKKEAVVHLSNKQKKWYPKNSVQVIDVLCKHNGSTYKGRKDASCFSLGIRQHPPILISQDPFILAFPCMCNKNNEISWINYGELKDVYASEKFETMFVFKNNIQHSIAMDVRSAIRQIQRCQTYVHLINNRPSMNIFDYL